MGYGKIGSNKAYYHQTSIPKKLDCEQWAKEPWFALDGHERVIITAKHRRRLLPLASDIAPQNKLHPLYPQHKNGEGDVVGELSQACKKYGLKFRFISRLGTDTRASYGSPTT